MRKAEEFLLTQIITWTWLKYSCSKIPRLKKSAFLLLLILSNVQQIESQETLYPDRIMLTIPGNPATSRAVSWCTVYEDTVSLGEIIISDATPDLEQRKVTISGTYMPWENESRIIMGHKVIFDNLKPSTQYAYRVGNKNNWSEWLQFETSAHKPEPFSFLYFGDIQNNIKSYGSRILRQAYSHFPDADFMLFAGDLVRVSSEEYWKEFFYAGGWIFGMLPSLPTPGNHEYDEQENGPRTFSKHWDQIFTLPLNGPSDKYKNRNYYIDYQGVRFISLDSPAFEGNDEDDEMVYGWLEQTLNENPNRWAIVFTHYPIYSCKQGVDNKRYRDRAKIILEKYGVDLVLQGHDHTYCRGQYLYSSGSDSPNHPMYIVSVAGQKMYGLNTSFLSDRVASNTQLYQYINLDRNELAYKSFTVTGELYDEFKIVKNTKGLNRIVVSRKPGVIEQRTQIPEGEETEYTIEELQKFYLKYPKK